MAFKVGSKGQIVVAKEIREKLGIEPGWMALQLLVDDHLEVYFVPPEHNRSLFGVLAPYVPEGLAGKDWHEVAEAAWEAAALERGARLEEDRRAHLGEE